MMPLTASGEVAALNGLLAARFVSLHTAVPTGGAEVAGGAYARQSYAYTTSGADPTTAANSSDIVFPTATASWGTVTHAGLYTAASAGTLLAWVALTTAKAVSIDDVVRFATGQLSFTAD